MIDVDAFFGFLQSAKKAYRTLCRPLCQDTGLTYTAFDILMCLGNHPSCKTASDIADTLHLKPNLISVNVDHLVKDGFLVRAGSEDDRRKIELQCTDKARSVIQQGREHQEVFYALLLDGFSDEDRARLNKILVVFNACVKQTPVEDEEEEE